MSSSAAHKTFRFLTTSQTQRLHQRFVNATAVPSQVNLLDSAIDGPMNAQYYGNQQNIFQLAANLSAKIMKNHAFPDGNKRTALVAADMFLKINGYELQKEPFHGQDDHNESLATAHVAVVTNKLTTEQLGDHYQSIATAVETRGP